MDNIESHVNAWNAILDKETGEYVGINLDKSINLDQLRCFDYPLVIKPSVGYIINRLACRQLVNAYLLDGCNVNLYEFMVNNKVTIMPFNDNMYDNFEFHVGYDSMNNDIICYPNKSIEELKEICKNMKNCVGFNSNGWMKSKIVNKKYLVKEPTFVKPHEGIYIDTSKRNKLLFDGYLFFEELDSVGSDIAHVSDKSIEELKQLCDNDPNCMGFNTLGWLKSSVNTSLVNLYGTSGSGYCDGLYVKDYSAQLIEVKNRIINRQNMGSDLTFTVTTCKRLDRFIDTMTNLLLKVNDLELIDKWILIDDNSSESDREYMMREYPFFTFIMKKPEERGHAKSMNMLWKAIDTTYVMHFEDDWRCNKSFSIKPYLDYLKDNKEFNHLILRRIGYNEEEVVTNIDDNNIYRYKYNKTHPLKPQINRVYDEIASNFISGDDDSELDVHWWWCNGFTLNCSIFNVVTLRDQVGYFKENLKQELFEYDYALRANNKGFKMAFVDLKIEHTGTIVSSYSLNDMKRYYDK